MWFVAGGIVLLFVAYVCAYIGFTRIADSSPVVEGEYSDLDRLGGVALGLGHDTEAL